MSAKRIAIHKIRDVLRLWLEVGLLVRQISICTKVSVGSIQKLFNSAQSLGLVWPLPVEFDDAKFANWFSEKLREQHVLWMNIG